MKEVFLVKDDFCGEIESVKASAEASGFGTWKPRGTIAGYSEYSGMNFNGNHAPLIKGLSESLGGRPVFPGCMFFRVTNDKTHKPMIHSDREHGEWTCIVYMSEHKEISGTAFWRHRKTGLCELPSLEEMTEDGTFELWQKDIKAASTKDFEKMDFVRGKFNRAVIFNAPLFHSRVSEAKGNRIVWVCHFNL
jgi:Family of unknown function (DUF6445)